MYAGVCGGDGTSCLAEFEFSCEVTTSGALADAIADQATLDAMTTDISAELGIAASRISNIEMSLEASYSRRRLAESGGVRLWVLLVQSSADGWTGSRETANAVCACACRVIYCRGFDSTPACMALVHSGCALWQSSGACCRCIAHRFTFVKARHAGTPHAGPCHPMLIARHTSLDTANIPLHRTPADQSSPRQRHVCVRHGRQRPGDRALVRAQVRQRLL